MESTQSLHYGASQSTLSVHFEPKQESISTATPLLDLNDATLIPRGWPTSPSRIKRPLSTMLLHGVFDIALFAFSACFLVFSLVVMQYNEAPTSENPTATSVLTRATKYGPTIFPILFASVVGRATHAILLWRLEKGERIQILDTLAASTSLTSTVTSQVHLRQISFLSVLLVAIWMLSPIGGQASLRQMSVETTVKRSIASFQYVVPGKISEEAVKMIPTVNSLFITALFASLSTEASPVDLWGNIKIPRIEHYEKIAKPNSDGWFETRPQYDDLAKYSSFVGIPVRGAQDNTTSTDYAFHLQTEYLQLTCAPVNHTTNGTSPYGELPPDTLNVTGKDGLIWWSDKRILERWTQAPETVQPFNLSYVERNWNASSKDAYLSSPTFDFDSFHRDGTIGSVSCSVETSYVEVQVWCAVNSTCQATKVRRSQLDQLPPAITIMDAKPGKNIYSNMYSFMDGFMASIGGEKKWTDPLGSILDNYLRAPSLVTAPQFASKDQVSQDTTKFSNEALSERFGHLLNSYWTCLHGIYTVTGGIRNDTSYFWDTNVTFVPPKVDNYSHQAEVTLGHYNWTNDYSAKSKVWSSQGNKHERIEILVAHKPWTIILAIASLILIAFSLAPPLVRHFLINGPDIAINFSSLATRNNFHIPIPAGGSFLPASGRFRLLKDLRLRFADVEGNSNIGSLVIAAQGVEKVEYSRIRKGRLYE